MAWIKLPAVSVANGDIVVSVTGNVDLSSVLSGWALIINGNYVEIKSGTSADGNGSSALTLAEAWDGSTITNLPAKIMPTSAPALEIAQLMTDTNEYAIDVHNALAEAATKDKDITITDPTGSDHTFASLPKNARLVQEAINENTEKVNDLLANKTTDGDDTTPGALLAVGAKLVSQIDLSDSNVAYVPNVQATMYLDFTSNEYKIYDSATSHILDKSVSDILDISRSTSTLVNTPTGAVSSIDADVAPLNYHAETGKSLGVRCNPSFTNLVTWSETDGTNYPISSSANWAGALVTVKGITLDNPNVANPIYRDFSTDKTYGSAKVFFRDDGVLTGIKVVLRFEIRGDTVSGVNFNFDFDNKVGSLSNTNYKFTLNYRGEGLYELDIYGSDDSLTNVTTYRLAVYNNEIYRGGFQATETYAPQPYRKTESSTVLESGTFLTRILGEEFNSNSGAMYIECSASYLLDNGFLYRFFSSEIGNLNSMFSNTTSRQFGLVEGDLNSVKVMMVWGENESRFYINGAASIVESTTPSEASILRIGRSSNLVETAFGVLNGHIRKVAIYPRSLSEEDALKATLLGVKFQ